MTYFVQILMSMIAAVGFSMMFNSHGVVLIINAIGGALTWGAYLFTMEMGGEDFVSCLVATTLCMTFAEIMARIAKRPMIMMLFPMLVPMVPGGDLYRMMSNLVIGNSDFANMYGHKLILEVGAIAFGIILVSTFLQIGKRAKHYLKGVRAQS